MSSESMRLTHASGAHPLVRLEPLTEGHRERLRAAAADPSIWRHWPRPAPSARWDADFDWQMAQQQAGGWLIHVILTPDGGAIGETCYIAFRPEHAGVEIGGTWLTPAAQAGPTNPAAKLLMIGHAFACGAERVELKTDTANMQSRAAILKLGATFEGVHRRHMRRPDGTWRDTAWYSILRPEWPAVRAGLERRLAAYR
jgi:N-acetyltransferase